MRKDIAGTPPLLTQILLTCSLFLTACDTDSTPNPTATSTSNITPTTVASPMLQLTPPGQTTSTTLPTSATTPSAEPTSDRAQPAAILMCAPDGEEAPRDSIGDPAYPKLGNAGYDTQHYTIDLEVDLERNVVSGTTTIRAVAARDLDGFNLDLERFDIRSVSVNDALARHSHRDNELTVTPASQLKAGDDFTVAISYGGEPNSDGASGATFSEGWISYDRGVYVAGEPSGAPSWYPVNDHPCDKATYTLRVTVEEPYVVAANGTLKSETDNGPTRTYLFEARDPMASYLVTVNIAEYEVISEQGPDGLPIRNYFPRSLDAEARAPYDDTSEMIEYFSGLFGPYPFEVYGVVVVDDDIGFALETQTLSLFGRSVGGFRATAEEVVAHELAHQWFGNSVSLRTWRDIWLNEGFASYAEWLWRERDSVEGLKSYMYGVHNFAREGRLGPPGDPSPDDLFNPTVYVRGGLTLHALRLTVGDDAFFRTLRAYAAEYRNSNADTAQFIAIAERESEKELDAFFQMWLYGEEVPDLPE